MGQFFQSVGVVVAANICTAALVYWIMMDDKAIKERRPTFRPPLAAIILTLIGLSSVVYAWWSLAHDG
jgi:membrane-anchored protein YejM (alkaline phosphatase superfamily)